MNRFLFKLNYVVNTDIVKTNNGPTPKTLS